MRTDEFDFSLPESLIAQHPPARRGASRLLHVHGGGLDDRQFTDLLALVQARDVLVLNDTRVIKARLFGTKQTGGQVEVMVERVLNDHEALAQVRASKPPKAGSYLHLAKGSPQSGGIPPDMPLRPTQQARSATMSSDPRGPAGMADRINVEVLGREGEFFHLRFVDEENVWTLLERHGRLPLPPYISHVAGVEDEQRYQTVFARADGAVAAPTAGLHFDEAMLQALRDKGARIAYVTLHVGAGTFQPVRAEFVREHTMHSERYEIPQATVDAIAHARGAQGRVIAVGTTSLRALESAAASRELESGAGETSIFITPGYAFRVVDVLLTNFHLPKSTLLMLVSAFGGMDAMRAAYKHAVEKEYRFFSYGDAMLIERASSK
jgi:S-adenosylmethionine:tRNA ribosyltransferase-isomerase